MKHITKDTMDALMGKNRKYLLRKCGFSEEEIKDGKTMYNALHDIEEISMPPCREHKFNVQCGNPASEAISLLSQAMDGFKELSPQEVDSIAHWFFKNFATTKDIS